MVVPHGAIQTPSYFRNFFSSILFMDEKNNSGKGLNPRLWAIRGILIIALVFFL
jgi:hypothetical protein